MRVPEPIKIMIRQCAYHNEIAYTLQSKIRTWLESKDIANHDTINQLIDSVEITGKDPEGFIKFLESDDFDKGNDPMCQ